MAYDEQLANRVRERLALFTEANEKAMMGGLVFMVDGKMCVGIIKDELMCRIHPDWQTELLEKEGCRIMDFTHRPMKGYILVDSSGMKTVNDLDQWIRLALEFNPLAKASKKKS